MKTKTVLDENVMRSGRLGWQENSARLRCSMTKQKNLKFYKLNTKKSCGCNSFLRLCAFYDAFLFCFALKLSPKILCQNIPKLFRQLYH